eukprot:gnl/TRDRNA2_/TRDRNA2_128559_c1_seq1.p1 gnl/TRDRNA2_/TRDRNA2_128559_c1~~gnl/TRDRNA2_/TRDRNA2_128559_c1_seq1.p1  ORF type:complete len:431 (-),score=36.42 gnl/TRDRNA2_/TRDRNA2_128559_c1_seq1:171-1463(-)
MQETTVAFAEPLLVPAAPRWSRKALRLSLLIGFGLSALWTCSAPPLAQAPMALLLSRIGSVQGPGWIRGLAAPRHVSRPSQGPRSTVPQPANAKLDSALRLGWDDPHVPVHRASGSVAAAASGEAATGRMQVAIAGATGMIGRRLVERLLAGGHHVHILTRDAAKARYMFPLGRVAVYEPESWRAAIGRGLDAVVNLAGEPIATRWSEEIKSELTRSRLEPTKLLVDAINACPADKKPKVFVSGSAIGFYGTDWNRVLDYKSTAGSGFLADLCVKWEAEAKRAEGVRVVNLRTGLVLDERGGILGRMLPMFQAFLGGPLGSGKQWFSWIHHEDQVGLIQFAIENDHVEGALDATAPAPVTLETFTSAMGRTLRRPSLLPVPGLPLQALLGEGATMVLEGQKVVPTKALDLGYKFKYPTVDQALRHLLASA